MGEKQQKYSLTDDLPRFESPKKNKISFFKRKKTKLPKKELLPPRPIDEKVHHSKAFKFVNGKSARNIIELKETVDSLSEISLKKHVHKDKHEISSWVGQHFNRPKLAKKLERAKSKKQIISVLEKHIEKELPPLTIPELPKFTQIQKPKLPKIKKKSGIPPRAPSKLGGKLAGSLPSLDDELIPPEPTKDMLVKNKSLFGKIKKTKQEHLEIDRLITREQESKRQQIKKKVLFKKETLLQEKELNLAEVEKAQTRQDEKLYSLKKVFDYDVRQRIGHVRIKDKELNSLKKELEEEKKHYEEKDKIIDKLRQRYLDFIAKEAHIEEKDKILEKKQIHIDQSMRKLETLNSSINQKFTKLTELNTGIQIEWKSKFSKFENLNYIHELKEKELLPKISRLQEDIILFTHKEKVLGKKYTELKEAKKQFKLLDNKKNETIKVLEKLKSTKMHLEEKSKILNQKEKELLKNLEKIEKNKELNENTNTLKTKLSKIEKRILDSSITLFNLPDLEKKNLVLDNRSKSLNQKEKELLKNLEKIEKNKELNENTNTLKIKLSKIEKRILDSSVILLNFSELERKGIELDNHSKSLDIKAKLLLKNLEKIEKNKELNENTNTLKTKLSKIEKRLQEKTKELLMLEEKTQILKDKDLKLDARKAKVERLEKQLKEEKKTISDKHKVYEKQMNDIMDNKFHSYLEKTIKKTQIPKDKDYKHNQIYIFIDNCKDLIDLGKLLEAKKLYNKIRLLFIELTLKGTEHQILKETIKDLYNQIKLASIK